MAQQGFTKESCWSLLLTLILDLTPDPKWRECQPGRWTGMIKDMVWTLSQADGTLYCLLHDYTKDRKDFLSPIDSHPQSLDETEPGNEFDSRRDLKPFNRRQNCSLSQDNSVQTLREKRESSKKGGNRKKMKTQMDAANSTTVNVSRKLQNSKQSCRSFGGNGPPTQLNSKQLCAPTNINSVEGLKNTLATNYVKDEKDSMADSPFISNNKIFCPVNEVKTSATIVDYYTRIIRSYFRLDLNLEELYKDWSAKDSNFCSISPSFPGIRMLDQPPVENVFSFICSSNNNIVRISQLVEKLCMHFGEVACDVGGTTWHSFPGIDELCGQDVDGRLRELGFGYRASYISQSAQRLASLGGEDWLQSLRLLPHEECRLQLRTLAGVGPKVADCICLMSMNHLSSVPVDTHVFQIAARDYLPELRGVKTVTDKVYKKIADHFRQLYGERAGWAHSVLFSADLKKFTHQEKVATK